MLWSGNFTLARLHANSEQLCTTLACSSPGVVVKDLYVIIAILNGGVIACTGAEGDAWWGEGGGPEDAAGCGGP